MDITLFNLEACGDHAADPQMGFNAQPSVSVCGGGGGSNGGATKGVKLIQVGRHI